MAETVSWVESSHEDLAEFPVDIREQASYALFLAQNGWRHEFARPWRVEDSVVAVIWSDGELMYWLTYVVVSDEVFVLHAFAQRMRRIGGEDEIDQDHAATINLRLAGVHMNGGQAW